MLDMGMREVTLKMAQIHPCDFYFVIHSRSALQGAKEECLVWSSLILLLQVKSDQGEAWACSVILGRRVLSGTLLALTSPWPTELHSLGH